MKKQLLNLLCVPLGLSVTLGTIPASLAAPGATTACTWVNKTKSHGFTQDQWNLANAMHRKFIQRFEREKNEYDRLHPIKKGEDLEQRKATLDEIFKQRLATEDPNFYREIQEGPDGWYDNDKDKETFRVRYWEYLTHIGWNKSAISQHSSHLKEAIAHTKTWPNGGSTEAVFIKNLTLSGLQDAIKELSAYDKQLDSLACGMGAWDVAWAGSIYQKAFKRYDLAYEVHVHNAKANDDAIAKLRQAENDRALRQMNANPTWRYLVNYFSHVPSVSPPGFRCSWGLRGDFSCSDGMGIYSRGPQW